MKKIITFVIFLVWMIGILKINKPIVEEVMVEPEICESNVINPYNITIDDVPQKLKKSEYSPYELAVLFLKSKEEFKTEAYPDHKQWSIGWGTKSYKGEKITLTEANRRFKEDFTGRYNQLRTKYPKIARTDALILTSLFYNVGSVGSRMNNALKKNDMSLVKKILPEYKHVLGEVNSGVLARRYAEIEILNTPDEKRSELIAELKKTVRKKIIAEKYK